MSDARPPWPGAKPERLSFPFDRASVAIAAIRELVEQFGDLRSALDQGITDLHAGVFEGEFSDWFTTTGDDLMGQIDARITTLDAQADDLTSHMASARRAVQDRDVSRQHWDRAHARWRDWEPATPSPASPGR